MPSAKESIAAERRQVIATGVSPWKDHPCDLEPRQGRHTPNVRQVAPLAGLEDSRFVVNPDLTVGLLLAVPSGLKTRNFKTYASGYE